MNSSHVAVFITTLALTSVGCGSDSCTPLAATDFGCSDPGDCLAVKITWNYPGASNRGSADLDLRLLYNDSTLVDYSGGTICRHTGDAQASGTEQKSEAIICDAPLDGKYDFSWRTFFIFDIDTRVDVNDRGSVTCSYEQRIGDVQI
ncbi:MAG: hypothetical protein WCF10_18865, partial [Polyangiales bacterium]